MAPLHAAELRGPGSNAQALINSAASGDTVILTNGATWSSAVTISGKAIHLRGDGLSSIIITGNVASGASLNIVKASSGNVRVSGLIFFPSASTASPSATFHVIASGAWSHPPILLHGCTFYGNGSYNIYAIDWKVNGGVIWSNKFYSSYHIVNGISSVISGTDWTNNSTMGTNDVNGTLNTYIEDNLFVQGFNACVNPDDNARIVFRNNTCSNATVSPHGGDTSLQGVRHLEVYNNTFRYSEAADPTTGMNYWGYIRGGSGVWTDNVMDNILFKSHEIFFVCQNIKRSGPNGCATTYPAFHQVGQGWENGSYNTNAFYVWGNTGGANMTPATADYPVDECGNGLSVATFIVENRDYILGAKPNYAKYTYPHPLRTDLGGGGGGESPSANFTINPPRRARRGFGRF